MSRRRRNGRPPKQVGGNHYERLNPQPIEVLEAWEQQGARLGFHLGQAFTYIARASLKGDELGDLEKARWYLARARTLVNKRIADRKDELDQDERDRQALVSKSYGHPDHGMCQHGQDPGLCFEC